MKAIESIGLTKKYNTMVTLNEITFSIEKDKIVGLIGRNGAGKTSLMKVCSGKIRQTSGQLTVLGQQPFDNLNVLSRLIYICENTQYDNSLKLRDILKVCSVYYSQWDKELEYVLMKNFDLKDKQKFNSLSRGMKTAFNIIIALCSRVDLTMMDEPTTGLDSATRKDFYNILLRTYLEYPRTFLISSHLIDEVENLLEEIILLNRGAVVFQGPIEEIQQYGIRINGRKDIVMPLIKDKQVFNIENLGNSVIAAVKNDLGRDDLDYISKNGISVAKMRVDDVCNYLTGDKGGEVSDR